MRSMSSRLASLSLILLAGLGLAGAAHAAGDAQKGKQLGYTCLGCHGIDNYKNVYPTYNVPRLVGQHPEYLQAALKAYRGKERAHGTMYAQASSLSDQDMADIAAYLSGPAVLEASAPAVGTAPAKVAALCQACHGLNGIGLNADYPTLAGQHADYLERALAEYKSGGRKNPVMAAFAPQLTNADIKEIAAYYAAQRPPLKTVLRKNFF